MTVILRPLWLSLILVITVPLSGVLAQSLPGDLDPSQLALLEQLSPTERDQLLNTLRENAPVSTDQPLTLPELVRRERLNQVEGEPNGVGIYDEEGRPILDSVGQPVRITEELLDELRTESPEDWYARNTPFFEQKLRLEPFGYDLFEAVPTTFAPATDIPVPNEYKLGPGDTIDVQLFGKENRLFNLVVNRDGTINFPNIGPVNVMGLNFQDLKQDILDRISEQLIGTSASVTMGALRSITVLVVGDARQPGSYTVSGLSTITNTLLASGGVSKVGSLRNIELRRAGKIIAKLDLYDLLLRGDARNDMRLESGDVIFIPPLGKTVGVGGFVRRPAIYELKAEKRVSELVALAGGLRPDAFPEGVRIERIDENFDRSFVDIDITTSAGQSEVLNSGDIMLVPPVLKGFQDGVRLLGHVERPGAYAWSPGMRLTDLIGDLDELRSQADLNYVVIRRVTRPTQRIQVLSANLAVALANPASAENVALQMRDEVSVFRLEQDRSVEAAALLGSRNQLPVGFAPLDGSADAARIDAQLAAQGRAALPAGQQIPGDPTQSDSSLVSFQALLSTLEAEEIEDPDATRTIRIAELLEELERQSGADMPFERITVTGQVRSPGDYPYEQGMRVSDLVRAGGGFTESAFQLAAELTRYEVMDGSFRTSQLREINLGAALAGDPEADVILAPSDFLTVRRIQNWENEITVYLEGEVRFPGTYTVKPGDTLSSVIKRAGGLTDQAFPQGGIFLREDLREREQQQIDSLRQRLQSDIASLTLQAAGSLENTSVLDARSAGAALLSTLNGTGATGRLVIDLPALVSDPGNLQIDVLVKNGDKLLVPRTTQAITVIGEVQFPTSHLYVPGLDRDGYIQRSGGLTSNSASKKIYLVRANGAVLASHSRWFQSGKKVQPGDTIVVPLDTQRGFRLQTWANITTIIYNTAIAVAAINGLSN